MCFDWVFVIAIVIAQVSWQMSAVVGSLHDAFQMPSWCLWTIHPSTAHQQWQSEKQTRMHSHTHTNTYRNSKQTNTHTHTRTMWFSQIKKQRLLFIKCNHIHTPQLITLIYISLNILVHSLHTNPQMLYIYTHMYISIFFLTNGSLLICKTAKMTDFCRCYPLETQLNFLRESRSL